MAIFEQVRGDCRVVGRRAVANRSDICAAQNAVIKSDPASKRVFSTAGTTSERYRSEPLPEITDMERYRSDSLAEITDMERCQSDPLAEITDVERYRFDSLSEITDMERCRSMVVALLIIAQRGRES